MGGFRRIRYGLTCVLIGANDIISLWGWYRAIWQTDHRARLTQGPTAPRFRPSRATHLLEAASDSRTLEQLRRHVNVEPEWHIWFEADPTRAKFGPCPVAAQRGDRWRI
jgi:hypothetical protein